MRATILLACAVCAASLISGCVQATLPERIYIGDNQPREDVDSSTIPVTHTHEEARLELRKAYSQIRYLENRLQDCEEKNRDLRAERDEYEDKYERAQDRYDD